MLLIVGGSIVLTVMITYWVRKRFPESVQQANNEVAGFIFAAVGVIYGVLLAFLVLVVWQAYQDATVNVEQEANTLVNAYRLAQELAQPASQQLETALANYGQEVVNDEWDKMAAGQESIQARDALEAIWTIHRQIHSNEGNPEVRDDALFATLNTLGNERRIRLLESHNDLPALMWVLLAGGAIVTIGFTLFFRVPNFRAHLLMAGMFAGLLAFVLFLIIELDSPFSGEIRVQPTAFQQSLDTFQRLQGR